MKPGRIPTGKEAVRYHLYWETVKKSDCTTDDVFRIFSLSTGLLYIAQGLPHLRRTSAPDET